MPLWRNDAYYIDIRSIKGVKQYVVEKLKIGIIVRNFDFLVVSCMS